MKLVSKNASVCVCRVMRKQTNKQKPVSRQFQVIGSEEVRNEVITKHD